MNYLDGFKYCPYCKGDLQVREVPGEKIRPACIECGWIHWKNPIPTAVVVIPVGDKYLMVKRAIDPQKGDWCHPGGYIDYLETPTTAGVREVKEETGLDIKIVGQLGPPFITESNHLVTVLEGEIIGGEMQAGDDAAELALYTADALPPNIAFPQHRTKVEEHSAGVQVCPFGCNEQPQIQASENEHCQEIEKRKSDEYYCPSPAVVTWFCLIYMALYLGLCLLIR